MKMQLQVLEGRIFQCLINLSLMKLTKSEIELAVFYVAAAQQQLLII